MSKKSHSAEKITPRGNNLGWANCEHTRADIDVMLGKDECPICLRERVEALEKALREWLDADDVLDPTRRDVNCDCYPHTRWREARAAARKLLEGK